MEHRKLQWRDSLKYINYSFCYILKSDVFLVMSKMSGKLLTRTYDKGTGYYKIQLLNNHNCWKLKYEHRVIADLYVENNRKGVADIVDHINRQKKDNSVRNLRWVTRSENLLNSIVQTNNKCGVQNVYYHNRDDLWVVKKTVNKNTTYKYFKDNVSAYNYANSLNNTVKLGIPSHPFSANKLL